MSINSKHAYVRTIPSPPSPSRKGQSFLQKTSHNPFLNKDIWTTDTPISYALYHVIITFMWEKHQSGVAKSNIAKSSTRYLMLYFSRKYWFEDLISSCNSWKNRRLRSYLNFVANSMTMGICLIPWLELDTWMPHPEPGSAGLNQAYTLRVP